jgi:hypothetical protein
VGLRECDVDCAAGAVVHRQSKKDVTISHRTAGLIFISTLKIQDVMPGGAIAPF